MQLQLTGCIHVQCCIPVMSFAMGHFPQASWQTIRDDHQPIADAHGAKIGIAGAAADVPA